MNKASRSKTRESKAVLMRPLPFRFRSTGCPTALNPAARQMLAGRASSPR